ncbi:MAG TPA: MlaD family protein [Anaeromyxobacter sp.]
MESRVNLAVVGAFVLVLAAAGIGAVLWIGSGRLSHKAQDGYVASFSESVAGLGKDAPVKLRGVDVGKVVEIAIDPQDPTRVRVVLSIERGTPVKVDSYATLQVQGLTGNAFVDLGGGSRSAAPLRPRPGEQLAVLETRPSLLARLDVAASSTMGDAGSVVAGLKAALDPETLGALRRSAAALPALVERLGRAAEALERMGNEVSETGVATRAAVEEARGAIRQVGEGVARFDAETAPEVRSLVADLREASASLARLTAELERDPGALVAGRAQAQPGPGE